MKFKITFFFCFFCFIIFGIDVKAYKSDNELIKQYMSGGFYYEAAKLYEKWAILFEKENMIKEATLTYAAGAKAYEKGYSIEESKINYSKAIKLADKMENDEKVLTLKNKWLANLGFIECYFSQNPVQANKYFDMVEYFFKTNELKEEYSTILYRKGIVNKLNNNYEKAIYYMNEASRIMKNVNKTEYYKILNELIDLFTLTKDKKGYASELAKIEEEILFSKDKNIITKYYFTKAKLSGSPEEKMKLFEICLQNIAETNDFSFKLKILISYAETFLYIKPNFARETLSTAYDLAKALKDERSLFTVSNMIGITYFNENKYSNAINFFKEALSAKKEGTFEKETLLININLGISYYNVNQNLDSVMILKETISKMEEMRNSVSVTDEKMKKYFGSIEDAYRYLILALIDNNNIKEAFNIYEQTRSRFFLKNLTLNSSLQNVNATEEEIAKFVEINNKIKTIQQKIDIGTSDIMEMIFFENQLQTYRSEFKDFIAGIEKKYPQFKELRNPKILKYEDIVKILKEDEAFLSFFLSKSNYVFICKKNLKAPLIFKLDSNIDSFGESLNNALYLSHKINSKQYVAAMDSLLKEGKNLYAMNESKNVQKMRGISMEKNIQNQTPDDLMEIVKNLYGYFSEKLITGEIYGELVNIKKIYYCPDGNLWAMPVEALIVKDYYDGSYYYLGDRFEISYIQSGSTLNVLKNKKQIDKEYAYDLIGFGAPTYPFTLKPDDTGIKKVFRKEPLSDKDLSLIIESVTEDIRKDYDGRNYKDYFDKKGLTWLELPYSKNEIIIASGIYSKNAKLFLGSQVSEEKVKFISQSGMLKQAKIVLFSVHGYVDKENPQMSALVLTQTDKVAAQDLDKYKIVDDGYLTSDEIINLKLDDQFVILSACETGKGKVEGGEGVSGLTQSFFIAGAKSVLVTLWSIGDNSTQQFMKIFLTKLKEGIPRHLALSETKKEFRSVFKDLSAPFFWAPFIIYGSID
ncbi:MAG TPA: CHAT domain-containing protein [Spirochaetota bacterium]|nr:CHAT domain-containing protein [Spirochaetota bacterium]HQB60216.1 CHAT domain-containing protein [Spirochaetota bacterium]